MIRVGECSFALRAGHLEFKDTARLKHAVNFAHDFVLVR
jgi:hypothetical protein